LIDDRFANIRNLEVLAKFLVKGLHPYFSSWVKTGSALIIRPPIALETIHFGRSLAFASASCLRISSLNLALVSISLCCKVAPLPSSSNFNAGAFCFLFFPIKSNCQHSSQQRDTEPKEGEMQNELNSQISQF